MWLWLTFSLIWGGGDLFLTHSGVKTPTNPTWAVVTEDGRVVILDTDQARLHMFDANGKLDQSLGREGAGPGEFLHPATLTLLDKRLIVTDSIAVSVFDLHGKYLKKIRLPRADALFSPVHGGYLGRVLFSNPPELWLYDENMASPQQFHEFDPITTNPTSGQKQPFNPTAGLPGAIVSRDGKKVFVQFPDRFLVLVYDVATREVVGQISRDEPALAFDQNWGRAQLEIARANLPPGTPLQYEADFPEVFPPIKNISLGPEGNLLITRWATQPGKPILSAYTSLGEDAQTVAYDESSRRRILAKHGDQVYITAFHDGQAAVGKVKPSAVKAFIEAHPVNFDWTAWMARQR